MNFYPIVTNAKQQMYTQEFRGLNRMERIADGELADMKNMTSDRYPVLSPRKKRRLAFGYEGYITAMLTVERAGFARPDLFWAGDGELFKNGERMSCLDGLLDGTDILHMVRMGAYIILFPQKVWLNTAVRVGSGYECGSLDNLFRAELSKEARLKITACDREGEILTGAVASMQEPSAPTEDMTWLDTSGETVVAKRWSVTQRIWVVMEGVHARLGFPGIGDGFSKGDGVVLGGLVTRYLMPNQIIEAVGPSEDGHSNWIVVTGLANSLGDVTKDALTVERRCPDMDYVVETGNRLWGCYYGLGENGEQLNEIYACALGDFRNWRKYQGISTDSYTASRGAPGSWTGAAVYHGRPVFFKRDCMDVVYPSSSGAHEISTTECAGVQASLLQGSTAVVDDILYWFTGSEVMAWDGTQPVSVSGVLGRMEHSGACAVGYNHKYYLGLAGGFGTESRTELLVYDARAKVWHKEDDKMPYAMCGGQTLYIALNTGIWEADAAADSEGLEEDILWMAETGDYGLSSPNRAYTSRFLIRLSMLRGSWADLYIQYDSTGVWEHQGHIVCGPWLQTVSVPVIPRRCDHLRFRIEGKGDCKLFAIARQAKEGSDVVW